MPTDIQIVKPLVTAKNPIVLSGTTGDLTGWFRSDGFSQIRGFITSTKAGRFRVLGNILPGTGVDRELDFKVLTIGTTYQFIVDVDSLYMKLEYVDPGGLGDSTLELDAFAQPISDLLSNRIETALVADILAGLALGVNVWVKRGANGLASRGTLVAGAPAAAVIPANVDRLSATLRNLHTAIIYWNYTQAGATDLLGFPLEPKETYTWKETTQVIYAFVPVASGNAPYATDQQLK